MSLDALVKAFEVRLPPHEKLVLIAITNSTRPDNNHALFNLQSIAKMTSLKRQEVQRALTKLEYLHEIITEIEIPQEETAQGVRQYIVHFEGPA